MQERERVRKRKRKREAEYLNEKDYVVYLAGLLSWANGLVYVAGVCVYSNHATVHTVAIVAQP